MVAIGRHRLYPELVETGKLFFHPKERVEISRKLKILTHI
jgi:hypothetical protein